MELHCLTVVKNGTPVLQCLAYLCCNVKLRFSHLYSNAHTLFSGVAISNKYYAHFCWSFKLLFFNTIINFIYNYDAPFKDVYQCPFSDARLKLHVYVTYKQRHCSAALNLTFRYLFFRRRYINNNIYPW